MKEMFHVACLVIAMLLLVGCGERSATTVGPRIYDRAGVEFEYPQAWEVTTDTQQAGPRYLFVETPGAALVIIQIHSADDASAIQYFAQDFARSAREETAVGNVSESTFGGVEEADGYEIVTERFTITLLGVNVPHTRTYRRKSIADNVCFIIAQVADEDRSKVTKGFEQIFSSFVHTP